MKMSAVFDPISSCSANYQLLMPISSIFLIQYNQLWDGFETAITTEWFLMRFYYYRVTTPYRYDHDLAKSHVFLVSFNA